MNGPCAHMPVRCPEEQNSSYDPHSPNFFWSRVLCHESEQNKVNGLNLYRTFQVLSLTLRAFCESHSPIHLHIHTVLLYTGLFRRYTVGTTVRATFE